MDATDDEWGTGTPSDPDRGFLGYVVRKVRMCTVCQYMMEKDGEEIPV